MPASLVRTIVISVLAFALPLTYSAYSNWDAVRPYVVGEATAEGRLLYFSRQG